MATTATSTASPPGTGPGASPRPRRSALERATALRLARDEYARFRGVLAELPDDDWRRPTACPGWDVRAMAGHVLGMAEMAASVRENLRQMRAARKRGGLFIDALTALQVEEHAHLTPAEVVTRFADAGPAAARGRRRTPAFVRNRRMRPDQPVGDAVEPWTVGFLVDVVLTRDTWMHRSDIAAATGRPMHVTATHDGVIVADVVAEWAGRHGRPYELRLTGLAGGRWSAGEGGPSYELDAVEFCRLLSGRGQGEGLLSVQVPF